MFKRLTQGLVGALVATTVSLGVTGIYVVDPAHASTHTTTSRIATTADAQQELANKIEKGFKDLFEKVIQENPDGSYSVRPSYTGDIDGISVEQAAEIADNLNVLRIASQNKGAKEYAICVLKGLIPFAGALDIDWGNLYIWIKQHSWGKLSKYLAKHAAKIGIKEVAKLTPGGIAVTVIGSAAACAILG